MAVVIRMARAGTNKKPFYHLVAADKERPRDGKYLERLGTFDPKLKDRAKRLVVDRAAVEAWVKKGAKVSETVGHLLKQAAK